MTTLAEFTRHNTRQKAHENYLHSGKTLELAHDLLQSNKNRQELDSGAVAEEISLAIKQDPFANQA